MRRAGLELIKWEKEKRPLPIWIRTGLIGRLSELNPTSTLRYALNEVIRKLTNDDQSNGNIYCAFDLIRRFKTR